MARQITDHHDGHGLAESIRITAADKPGPGGANHYYLVTAGPLVRRVEVASIQYQMGPRDEEGSTPGVLDSCLLAIIADRMKSFQAGPFACPANDLVLNAVHGAIRVLKARADERAARGVLGKNEK